MRTINYKNYESEVIEVNTCVVGTGAAGYNAASLLFQQGQKDILLISENRESGTSRNTGSDKQTYYKLTLSGNTPDSVFEMASTLFDGECVDGDIALCEAALSTQSFLRLAGLGVPFPVNRYGEYVGYKTDHDPRTRATSVGPYTSKKMTEVLEKDVEEKQIRTLDQMLVIKVLSDKEKTYGLLCWKKDEKRYVTIQCPNIVFATGGPAGIYKNVVYPGSQHGSSGLAFEAGVYGKNLTEWQFGLASIKPRWNVSGTYMQVLPRFVSTDENGENAREFLPDFFSDKGKMLTNIFLKGYQWPFDVRKVASGSSIIDILVYLELQKGRRVFLDFTEDNCNGEFTFEQLESEAYDYLYRANALVSKPIERLKIMNQPAIDFYRDKGVNLEKEWLEISLCAQHNNGGLDIDLWWQTNLEGFFAVGEVAGSHGVYRPGGSALNAGQVGSNRAAQFIANCRKNVLVDQKQFEKIAVSALSDMVEIKERTLGTESTVSEIKNKATSLMSETAGAIRNEKAIESALQYINEVNMHFNEKVVYCDEAELSQVYQLRDTLISQIVYLNAMLDYSKVSGLSRGSALYTNLNGTKPFAQLDERFTYIVDDGSRKDLIQIISYLNGQCETHWRKRRELPENDDFFENTWKSYRENKNIY